MAIQSGWLLAGEVVSAGDLSERALAAACAGYGRAWRDQFAARVRASSAFAQLALATPAPRAGGLLMARVPQLLTWGARRSGKALGLKALEAFP